MDDAEGERIRMEAIRLSKESRGSPFILTARECAVLELIAKGHTDNEVAEALYVSNRTVRSHLGRIYEKLGVHNRTEAALLWHGIDCRKPEGIP